MALANRQVEIARHGDITAGRTVDTVVDKETGIIAERERVAVHDGNNLVIAERIRAIHMPTWIQEGVQRGRGMPFTGNHSSYDMRSGENSESSSGPLLMMFRLCCFFCFLPCIANKFCLFLLQCCVWAGVIVFTVMTAVGPINCTDLQSASIVVFIIMGIVILMSVICIFYAFVGMKEECSSIQALLSLCACFFGFVFIGVVIAGTALTAVGFSDSNNVDQCQFGGVVIGAIAFAYTLMAFSAYCWCLCCCCVMSSSKSDE